MPLSGWPAKLSREAAHRCPGLERNRCRSEYYLSVLRAFARVRPSVSARAADLNTTLRSLRARFARSRGTAFDLVRGAANLNTTTFRSVRGLRGHEVLPSVGPCALGDDVRCRRGRSRGGVGGGGWGPLPPAGGGGLGAGGRVGSGRGSGRVAGRVGLGRVVDRVAVRLKYANKQTSHKYETYDKKVVWEIIAS
jgi:hypothetical protein